MTAPAPIAPDALILPRRPAEGPADLVGLPRPALPAALAAAGVPEAQAAMRAAQIWQWIYHRGVRDFEAMTNLGRDVRRALAARFVVGRPEVAARQVSADGTRKYLLRIAGGHEIETVYIPETDRGTLCVSSQVGCTLTCSFCHTGTQRLVRNLTAAEIVGQVLVARDDLGDWGRGPAEKRLVSNLVLMGMGEPLYNFEAVRDAMKIAMDGEGIALSRRRITLSTSGVVPEIARVGTEIGCLLAISFHATTDAVRDALVPINRKWPIADAARRLPRLPAALQRRAHHLRIRDAEGRQRQRRRRPPAGEADRRHPGQDQPHPVQRLARRPLHPLRPRPHRGVRPHRQPRRLRLAGAHPARRGHHGRLRPAPQRQRARPAARGRPYQRSRPDN